MFNFLKKKNQNNDTSEVKLEASKEVLDNSNLLLTKTDFNAVDVLPELFKFETYLKFIDDQDKDGSPARFLVGEPGSGVAIKVDKNARLRNSKDRNRLESLEPNPTMQLDGKTFGVNEDRHLVTVSSLGDIEFLISKSKIDEEDVTVFETYTKMVYVYGSCDEYSPYDIESRPMTAITVLAELTPLNYLFFRTVGYNWAEEKNEQQHLYWKVSIPSTGALPVLREVDPSLVSIYL